MRKFSKICILLAFFGLSIGAVNAQTWQIGSPNAVDLTATLDASGTMTISGTGAMQSFGSGNAPWYSIRSTITALVIQNGVTNIGNGAFFGCSSIIGNLNFPNSVTAIGFMAFENCSGFTGNLKIPNLVTSIDDEAFTNCSGFTGNLTIPNLVISIGNYAFNGCIGFTGLIIPNSVTSIGDDAFSYCNGLLSITCLNPNPTTITLGGDVFWNINKTTCVLKVPTGSYSAYHTAPQWSDFTTIEEVATGIENIELQNLKIYPNPVKDELKIESGELKINNVEICDIAGKTILIPHSSLLDTHYLILDTNSLLQGIYLVKIYTDKGVVTQRVVKN